MARFDRSRAGAGALMGVGYWLTYATVEHGLLWVIPWLRQPAFTYRGTHWGLTALLFAAYAACGALLGALVAVSAQGRGRGGAAASPAAEGAPPREAVALTLVLAFALNALVEMPEAPLAMAVPLANTAALAALLVLMLRAPAAARLRARLRGPWCVAILLAGGGRGWPRICSSPRVPR